MSADGGEGATAAVDAPAAPSLVPRWAIEVGVASLLAALALLAIADSLRVGAGWGADGPQPGFFPFYVALILLASSLSTALSGVRAGRRGDAEPFVDRAGARAVLAVLIPTALFVAASAWIGLYVATVALIAFFMRARGGYGLGPAVGLAVAVALAIFVVFELWFLMPLPKGPLEAWLGL